MGDTNNDGVLGVSDLNTLIANWKWIASQQSYPAHSTSSPADFNGDGFVNATDAQWLANYITFFNQYGYIYAGDLNNDHVVDINDFAVMANDLSQIPADINEDGKVDYVDLKYLVDHWATHPSNGRIGGDLVADGSIDNADFGILADWWGFGTNPYVSQLPGIPIPEPSPVAIIATGSLLLLYCARHRCQYRPKVPGRGCARVSRPRTTPIAGLPRLSLLTPPSC